MGDDVRERIPAVVWSEPGQAPAVGRVLELVSDEVEVTAMGGPRDARVAALAADLGLKPEDDLRHLLVANPSAFVLFAAVDDEALDDLAAAAAAGAVVLALEPLVQDMGVLGRLDARAPIAGMLAACPAMRRSPGFVRAAEPFDLLEGERTLAIQSLGARPEGSLFARLLDAWLTALSFVDLPETIDAQYAAAEDAPAGGLRAMSGRLTAHGRLSTGSSVAMLVSDRAAGHRRALTVLAGRSQLDIDDASYRLAGPGGEVIDASSPAGAMGYADLVAEAWRRRIELLRDGGTGERVTPAEVRAALACCHAAALSARTGQPEDPRAVMRMAMG